MQALPKKTEGSLTSNALEALSVAVEAGDHSKVRILLEGGADVNAVTRNGMSLLMRASCDGRLDIIQSLLDRGADLNAKRSDGFTALSFAAFFGHIEAVRLLLRRGADTTAKSRFGTSAEMWASARGFKEIVTLLRDSTPKPKLSPPPLPQPHHAVQQTKERHKPEVEERAPALPEDGLEYLPEVPPPLPDSVSAQRNYARWSKVAMAVITLVLATGTSLALFTSFRRSFASVETQAVDPVLVPPISPISENAALEPAVIPNVTGEADEKFTEESAKANPTAIRESGNQRNPRIIQNQRLPKSVHMGTEARKTGLSELEVEPAPLIISSSGQTESSIPEKPRRVIENVTAERPQQALDGSIISNKPKKKVIRWP